MGPLSGSSLIAILPVLLQRVPEMLDEVSRALSTVDQEYAEFLHDGREEALEPTRVAVRRLVWGAQQSLRARADERDGTPPEAPAQPLGAGDAALPGDDLIWGIFAELGREQFRRDLPVRTLLSAYQVGGRTAWRHLAATAVEHGLPPQALVALAEQVFFLVDELGSATTAGYVEEQARAGDPREQLRDALIDGLLSGHAERADLEAAARRAGWRLPTDATVVLLRPGDHAGWGGVARLGADCLRLRHTPLPGVIVPDPSAPGRRQRLVSALRGTSALVGPAVPPERLALSVHLTEVAARTLGPPDRTRTPVFVAEHLDALIVHRDPQLLAALRAQCLRPLHGLPAASRDALRQTLRAWLRHMGSRTAIAAELGIHPQTVRYRLGRLRELFGPALDDPDVRLRLTLVLGWEPLDGAVPAARPAAMRDVPTPRRSSRTGEVARQAAGGRPTRRPG